MLSKERTLIVSVTTFEMKGIDPEDLLGFRRQSFDHGVCCGYKDGDHKKLEGLVSITRN